MNSLTSLGYVHFISDNFSYRHGKLSLVVVWQATAQNWNKSLTHIARHAKGRNEWPTMTDRFGELNPSPPSWIFTASSAPLSYLFTSATVLIHMHQSVALTKSARRSIAPSQKRRRNHLSYVRTEALSGMNFVPAQKLYIFYSANIALIRCTSVTTFTVISVFDLLDFMPINGPLAFSGFVFFGSN